MSDVHQLPIGHPQDIPTAHEELVEQPWLIYESTADWRADLVVKHEHVATAQYEDVLDEVGVVL